MSPVSKFLTLQTVSLVVVAVWSLGGRADGALLIIAGIAWSSLLAFAFESKSLCAIKAALSSWRSALPLVSWLLLIFWLLLAPLNAQWKVFSDLDGLVALHPLPYFPSLPSSLVHARCQEYGFLLSGLLIQALLLWHFLERSSLRKILTIIAWNSLFCGTVGIVFRLASSERVLGLAEPVTRTFFSSFRYHNHWTAFALLGMGQCLSLAIYWYMRARCDVGLRRTRPDFIWIVGLFLLSVTLPMTTARAGVLFLVLFWSFLSFYIVVRLLRQSKESRQTFRRTFAVILIVFFAGFVIAYSIWSNRTGLESRWQKTLNQYSVLSVSGVGSFDHGRTDSWGDCWRMFQDSPVYGWGYGSHLYLYPIYARDIYRDDSGVAKHLKEFAHNDLMQYLAEFGLLGLLLLLFPPVLLVIRYRKELTGKPRVAALIFPCGLVLILASFEFPLSNPAVLTVFIVQSTLALKFAEQRSRL